jgi:predicted ATP-binding protein involved in virulence
MYIRDIEIQNFKRFKEFRCAFHDRFTLLVGANGTGKTSLLDAAKGIAISYWSWIGYNYTTLDRNLAYATIASDVGGSDWREQQFPIKISGHTDIEGLSDKDGSHVMTLVVHSNGEQEAPLLNTVYPHLQNRGKTMFEDSFQEPLSVFFQYAAIKPQGSSRKVRPSKPFGDKKNALDAQSQINLTTVASWFYHFSQRSLQEKKQPLIFKKVKEAVLNAIHAEDIDYIVRSDSLEVKYSDQGWRPFDELSDGQQRIAAIFCDLAMRCASVNSHLGDNCIRETSGVVTIDELDLHLHPKWQREVIPDLRRTFPNIQFIAASHSPFLLQAAFENGGKVVDMTTGKFMVADGTSIEDIAEHNMDISVPQRGQHFQELQAAAESYYELLEQVPEATEEQKTSIKAKLDTLLIPYTNNLAYAAMLEMRRKAAGI